MAVHTEALGVGKQEGNGDCLNRSETETRQAPQPHPEQPTNREHQYERQDQELGCRARGNGDAGQVMGAITALHPETTTAY